MRLLPASRLWRLLSTRNSVFSDIDIRAASSARRSVLELIELNTSLRTCGEGLEPLLAFGKDAQRWKRLVAHAATTSDVHLGLSMFQAQRILRFGGVPASLTHRLAAHILHLHSTTALPDPVVLAEMCCHLGVAQTDMAEYFAAADSFKRGFAALQSAGVDSDDVAGGQKIWVRVCLKFHFGRLLSKGAGLNRGYEMQARIQLEQALAECLLLPRGRDAELFTAEVKAALSLVLTTQTQAVFVQAEQLVVEAIETQEAAGDVTSLTESLNNFGMLLARQGRRAESRQAFHRNLKLRRRIFPGGIAHMDVAEALMNTASLEPAPEKALPLYLEAVDILESIVSAATHDQETSSPTATATATVTATPTPNDMMALVLAPALDGLGVTLGQLSRLDEAIGVFKRALDIRRSKLRRHRDTATSASNLAHVICLAAFRDPESKLRKRQPSLMERLLGRGTEDSDKLDAAAAASAEADSLMKEAVDILRHLDPQSQALAEALCQRAEVLMQCRGALTGENTEVGRAGEDESRALLGEALEILVRELGDEHASVQHAKALLESVNGRGQ